MRRPDRARGPDMQDFVSNLHLDVLQQVFVDCDRGRRRTTVPFDPESAAGFDVDKGIDIPLFADQVAVAANATDVAPRESEKQADGKNMLLHRKTLEVGCRQGPVWIQKSSAERERGGAGVMVSSTVSVSLSST